MLEARPHPRASLSASRRSGVNPLEWLADFGSRGHRCLGDSPGVRFDIVRDLAAPEVLRERL